MTALAQTPSQPVSRHRRRPAARRRRVWPAVLGILVVVIAVVGWLAFRGLQAKNHLLRAASEVSTLQAETDADNTAGAQATLANLQADTKAARAETSDPIWRAVGVVPYLGRNTTTVTTVAAAVDDLAVRALPPLLQASTTVDLNQLAPHNGTVDLTALQAVTAPVLSADQAVQRIDAQISGLSTSGLIPPLHEAVTRLRTQLASAAKTTANARRAVTLLPSMLGATGPRTYAVLFLNNAELRADGGIAGSWAIIRTDHGHVSIVNQGSDADVNARLKGVAVPADVASVFTDRAGTFFQDVTLTPDFPVAAQLAASMFAQAYGVQVDGVVATDPVALAGLLHATGPVTLATGQTLTSDNAVSLLLSDVYREVPDPALQDAFFAEAAQGVFGALSSGQGDPRAVVQSLSTAADAGRMSIWSAHKAEEAQLVATPLAGELPTHDAAGQPTIGVFFDDGTAAKLDYYLRAKVDVSSSNCQSSRAGYNVRITLTSTVPDPASLPSYVVGAGVAGLATGSIRTQVYVYAPSDGAVTNATLGGAVAKLGAGVESGRQVGIVTVDLAPGQSTVLDVNLLSGQLTKSELAGGVAPLLRVTPMAVAPLLQSAATGCRIS